MQGHIACIVNPASSSWRGRRKWPQFSRRLCELGLHHNALFTDRQGAASKLTRYALKNGASTIVCVGGDGTLNEVVNGFFEHGKLINPEAKLALVAKGTGSDFWKSLAIPHEPDAAADIIKANHTFPVDIGYVHCIDLDGTPISRYFINIAELGYGGQLIKRMNGFAKYLGGKLSYFLALIITLLLYRNKTLSFRIDDGDLNEGVFNAIIAANGQYFGGGMWIAPRALLDDGQIDVVSLTCLNKIEVVRALPRLYDGTILEVPKIEWHRGKKIEIQTEQTIYVEADGEFLGKAPVTFEMTGQKIPVIVAASEVAQSGLPKDSGEFSDTQRSL